MGKKSMKIGIFVSMFCMLILSSCGLQKLEGETERGKETGKQVLYVAGDKNDYPIEYYDIFEKKFKGAMPDLLDRLSEETQIEFVYIPNDKGDRLVENQQVDIVTGEISQEMEQTYGLTLGPVCFRLFAEEQEQEILLAFTSIVDEKIIVSVIGALQNVAEEEREQILYHNIANGTHNYQNKIIIMVLGVFLLSAVLCLGTLLVLYRKWKSKYLSIQKRDGITGYGNFSCLKDTYKKVVTEENYSTYCVVELSVRGFPQFKEEYGLSERDAALRLVADKVAEFITENEYFARTSGANYSLLLKYMSKKKFSKRLREGLIEKIKEEFQKSEIYEKLKPLGGVYFLNGADTALSEPIICAMMAKKWAKENNEDIGVFDVMYEARVHMDWELERSVEVAIENGEFIPYFHPNFMVGSNEVLSYEVLARWQNKERGMLFPEKFIPILRKKGLLSRLDISLFQAVCKLIMEREREGTRALFCTFNFSAESLRTSWFLEELFQIIKKYKIQCHHLSIDITENITAENKKDIMRKINELKSWGFLITLDNFGGEYSNFVDLGSYNINYMKLDKTLMVDRKNEKTRLVLKGMVELCHSIGVKVMCEGVENKEQYDMLREVNCDVAQGYYFCQPMPYEEIDSQQGKE